MRRSRRLSVPAYCPARRLLASLASGTQGRQAIARYFTVGDGASLGGVYRSVTDGEEP